MTQSIQVQGWCPTAWQPMRAQDGWIVRVRPHCAAVSAAQWRVLAVSALAHAHPQIELTRLGNVQLRGVGTAQLPVVRARLIEAGLVPADADADLAPAVHCTALYRRGDATHALARQLSQAAIEHLSPAALARAGLQALPSKFGLLVDDPARRMQSIGADLQLWVDQDAGYGLALGGTAQWHGFARAEEAVDAAVQLALWFARERMTTAPAPTRLRGLLAQRTPQVGAPLHAALMQRADPLLPGPHAAHGQVLGAPLGRIDAAAMQELARQLPADAELRVTPWRSLLLADRAITPLDAAHWITRPDDARLRVSACTGAPRCTQGLVAAQTLALALAGDVPRHRHLHVSGCAKFCALPAEASAVLCAGPDAGGKALLHISRGNAPRTPISSVAADRAPAEITRLLHDPYL
ncbi:nitrite reductase [Comamonas endophytica]|uniref:Nitrite reductase n=1 Tax=Comamonas endophytica TaxID=2949090 RepID=A0ABY6G8Z8_9BURK|nr:MULTISPECIES: nitrite reductase [unclassified Acidovorax]MCD2511439.1 nitrite reductase [Acidovorax sp. D4N7]UYG50830.1 nitrite reductase [Acidovorax sp. 5MLIR]